MCRSRSLFPSRLYSTDSTPEIVPLTSMCRTNVRCHPCAVIKHAVILSESRRILYTVTIMTGKAMVLEQYTYSGFYDGFVVNVLSYCRIVFDVLIACGEFEAACEVIVSVEAYYPLVIDAIDCVGVVITVFIGQVSGQPPSVICYIGIYSAHGMARG